MEKRHGSKTTFVVKITNTQNGTWQGKIIWAEENRTQYFRSMLEMIRLMDEATASAQFITEKASNQ